MKSYGLKLASVVLIGSSAFFGLNASAQEATEAKEPVSVPTNRVAVPLSVRQNLGITFAKVESRVVANTIRIPGRFELKPSARRDYVAPLGGRIKLLVDQYQNVDAGDPLFQVHSPEWTILKTEMLEAERAAELYTRRAEAHEGHHAALENQHELWKTRVAQLEELQGPGGASRSDLHEARRNLADAEAAVADSREKVAEMQIEAVPFSDRPGKPGTNGRLLAALEKAAVLLGTTVEDLTADVSGTPKWKTLDALTITASGAGVVESLAATQGGIAQGNTLVVSIVDPNAVRFRAKAMQSDAARIAPGAAVAVVPLDTAASGALAGTITFGLEAHSTNRTIDLIADLEGVGEAGWARPGIAAIAEVTIAGGGSEELAVPRRAVIQDGLQRILFRRDPSDPDSVIRMEADAGVSNGRWVEILSGLAEGDEVVLGGVYELMLGSSTDGTRQEGGHFHSDGSFHEAH